nr:MAG TPA: hypothetical protein [Caudoviricetes sp.]
MNTTSSLLMASSFAAVTQSPSASKSIMTVSRTSKLRR